MINIILTVLLSTLVISCDKTNFQNENTTHKTEKDNSVMGYYIDEYYQAKNKGSDWIAISVEKDTSNSILISVRSRADKKKPTCTFDAKAYKQNENKYESVYDGKKIIYDFWENSIVVSTENKTDEGILYFFCSGGATFAGTYLKTNQVFATEINK